MDFADLVDRYNDCRVTRVDREGCSVTVDGSDPRLAIFDCDRCEDARERDDELCDFLLLRAGRARDAGMLVGAMELKSGHWHASKVLAQLDGGSRVLECLTGDQKCRKLIAVLVHCGGAHRNEFRVLRERKVLHRGKRYPIRLLKSGQSLSRLLDDVDPP